MKKNIEIVYLLDRSGSMGGKESDVIGGFNSLLKEQKLLKDPAKWTTVLFDDRYEVLHNGLDLQTVPEISPREYYVRGATALLDAVGKTINTVKSHITKKTKVLFVINTDGLENASKEYSKDQVQKMVKELTEKGWKFLFLGADMDAISAGISIGISGHLSFGTQNTHEGISDMYAALNITTKSFRESRGTTVDTSTLEDLSVKQ